MENTELSAEFTKLAHQLSAVAKGLAEFSEQNDIHEIVRRNIDNSFMLIAAAAGDLLAAVENMRPDPTAN